jgi:hypothetical protein
MEPIAKVKPPLGTTDAYWEALQQSIDHPRFSYALASCLRMVSPYEWGNCDVTSAHPNTMGPHDEKRDQSSCPSEDSLSSASHQEESQAQDSLADAFHDCIIVLQHRLNLKWQDWISLETIAAHMPRFVKQIELWEEWSNTEQLEACIAFAMAFENIGVMAVRSHKSGEPYEVSFRAQPNV